MRVITGSWKVRLYWTALLAFCLVLLLVILSLMGAQPGIVLALAFLFVCGVGATIDRYLGPERWNGRRPISQLSARAWLRREVGVAVSAPEAQRMDLALGPIGDPLTIVRGCAWMKWLATEHEKRSALSHYVVLVSGARPPFGKPKKTRASEQSVSRARRYLGAPDASPRDLAVALLERGTLLQLDSAIPAERERAEREATDLCLEYRSLMGWR